MFEDFWPWTLLFNFHSSIVLCLIPWFYHRSDSIYELQFILYFRPGGEITPGEDEVEGLKRAMAEVESVFHYCLSSSYEYLVSWGAENHVILILKSVMYVDSIICFTIVYLSSLKLYTLLVCLVFLVDLKCFYVSLDFRKSRWYRKSWLDSWRLIS